MGALVLAGDAAVVGPDGRPDVVNAFRDPGEEADVSHVDPHIVLGVCVCPCPKCTDHPGSTHVTRCICPDCPRSRCGAKDGVVSSATGGVTGVVTPATVARGAEGRRERGSALPVLLAVLAVAVVVALVYGLLSIAADRLPCQAAPDTCPVATR